MQSKQNLRLPLLLSVLFLGFMCTTGSYAFDFGFLTKNKSETTPLREGFTCCNLHYEGDWISDANWGALPFIPAGTPAKVTDFGRYRVYVTMGDKPMRIGLDYGRAQETLQQFADKMVVLEDPKLKIAKFPSHIREAIRAGQVVEGMTKEQAIIAVGYPEADRTPSLDSTVWSYWIGSFESYQLIWGKDGRIKQIDTDPATRARMVYQRAN